MKVKCYSAIKKKITTLLLLVVFLSTTSYGQRDSLANEQDTSFVQKVANLADWGLDILTFEGENYTFFLLPVAAYEERTKLVLGVMPVWRFYLGKGKSVGQSKNVYFRPSNISPSVIFSTNGMYGLEMSSDFYFKNNWYLQNKWQYQSVFDKFYAIGNEANKDLFLEVDIRKIEILGKAMKGLSKEIFAGINYDLGIYDVRYEDDGILNSNIPGYDGQRVVGMGPTATFDNRNSVVYPSSGSFVNLSYLWYPKKISNFTFSSITFDARHFIKLDAQGQVLATQFYLKSATGNIPFYRLPVLGGKNLFRGISRPYKYMDNNSMYLQTAYRSHLWWRLGYEVFAGTGKVYHQWDSSMLKNLHLMGGLGVRFKLLEKEGLNVRLDYGISSTGDNGLYFTLGEAF